MDRFITLINKNSGSVQRLGADNVASMLGDRMGSQIAAIELLEPGDMQAMLHLLAKEKPDGVIVGGGDGTAVCAAEILGPAGVPFAVLPLGTMNLLAQDLGSAPTFEQTLERFDGLSLDKIDVGVVNDRLFLCSAVIGLVPEGAIAREELREAVSVETMARFLSTIRRGMGGETKQSLTLSLREGEPGFTLETTSLIISNNAFIRSPANGAERFLRETMTGAKLAVYSAAPKDMMDGLKMALSLLQGDWQDHESVMSFETPEMVVNTQDTDILISLDGEPVTMMLPLRFSVQAKGLSVLRMELAA